MIEKRVFDLERKTEKLEERLRASEQAFRTFKDAVVRLHDENTALKKEKNALSMELAAIAVKNISNPVIKSAKNNLMIIRNFSSSDSLFELVKNSAGIKIDSAAQKLGMSRSRVKELAELLEANGLLEIDGEYLKSV